MTRLKKMLLAENGSSSIEVVGMAIIFALITALLVEAFVISSAIEATQRAARDIAVAEMRRIPDKEIIDNSVPKWLPIVNIRRGSEVPGCIGTCVEVTTLVPIGLESFALGHTEITRRAILPRGR